MAVDEEGLKSWAGNKKPGVEPDGDEPDGDEEAPPEEEKGGESQGDEDLDTLVQLVEAHLPDIEAAAGAMDPGEILGDDELSEEATDQILSALEGMDAELSDELSGIEYRVATEIADHFKDELQEVTPPILAAWLYRAGQLV